MFASRFGFPIQISVQFSKGAFGQVLCVCALLFPREAQPVVGKKITHLNLQLDGDHTLSAIFSGHTWPYRGRLDAIGVSGGFSPEDDNESGSRKYYRVWKDIDVSDAVQQQKFFSMLQDVFKDVATRVSLDRCPEADTHAGAFVELLRQRQALFFTADPPRVAPKNDDENAALEQQDSQLPQV